MKWQPIHERKKLGMTLLEEERAQETTAEGLKELFSEPELKPEVKVETPKETKPSEADDFVFMLQGSEITRAKDLKELLDTMQIVPKKSVIYHINNGDFSRWFDALGHKELAENVRNIRGGHKAVIKQLRRECNSALAQQVDYIQ